MAVGEDIRDKTLLVHTEQRAGDAIQFIRYLPLVGGWQRFVKFTVISLLIPLLAIV